MCDGMHCPSGCAIGDSARLPSPFRPRPVSVMDLLALATQRRRVSLAPEPAAPGPATADEERVPDERLAVKEVVPDEGLAVDGWRRKLWSDRVVWVKRIDGRRV